MSLFGGDNGPPRSPSQGSDFSISTIGDEGFQDAQVVDTQDFDDDDDDHQEEQHVVAGAEDEQDDATAKANRSPSATFESSDTTAVRQNRFRGSDRAWLHHTHAERTLAHSLDQLSATDLALHLYSAHHLKARSRSLALDKSSKPWSRKARWQSIAQDGQRPWYPDSDWTAWPLHPTIAPAGDEEFGAVNDGLDGFTVKKHVSSSPAHNLQDQIYAVMLAQASRSWKSANPRIHAATHQAPSKPASDHVDSPSGRPRSLSAAPSLSRWSPLDSHVPPSSSIIDMVMPASIDSNIPELQNGTSPQPEDSIKPEDANADKAEVLADLVFSADDDQSHKILHPTVRHIMSKLDSLLLALHQSRQPHTYRPREGGDTSDSSARSTSRSRSKSKKSPLSHGTNKHTAQSRRSTRSASGKTTPVPADHVMVDDSDEDETYYPSAAEHKRDHQHASDSSSSEAASETKSPTSTKRRVKSRKPGLRDWSEVLGIAALNGWDSAALQKTQQRCKDLFNEDMDLYVMPEYGESTSDEDVHGPRSSLNPAQLAGWRCPFVNCFRHISPLDQGFRWREHMRKAHKQENAEIARLEEQLVKSGDISLGIKRRNALAHNPRGWIPPDPLKCPHCTNAETTYPKVGRLLEHIRRNHKYDPRVDAIPKSLRKSSGTTGQPSSDDDGSDDFLVGGVHNDGFLQPIHRHFGVRGEDAAPRKKRTNKALSKVGPRSARRRTSSEDVEEGAAENADVDMQD